MMIMKIYNYIKDAICEPIVAENRKEADELFVSTFKVEINDIQKDNDKNQYKFEFYETAK